jgi:hypothetical protein
MKGKHGSKPKNISRHSWMKSLRLAAKTKNKRQHTLGS